MKPPLIRAKLVATMVLLTLGVIVFQTRAAEQSPKKEGVPSAPAEKVYAAGFDDTPFLPDSKWRVHDIARPQPTVVTPGTFSLGSQPPADAMVLFDGTDLSQWIGKGKVRSQGKTTLEIHQAPSWIVRDGYTEGAAPDSLVSRKAFGDCQLHIEWASPDTPVANSVGRGNSGILMMEKYEIQILDSFDNRAYADGHAGSIYGQYPPLVNAARAPGEWQAYDILFEAPRFDGEQVVKPAYVTLIHNGIVVQNHVELIGAVAHKNVGQYSPHPAKAPISLQFHGNPVRFRNIWVRSIKQHGAR